ncbi:Chromatin associated protein [Mycena indigotica]|uniref:Chromatin associated protein n=1 Tax=Mycena indigotica TaxID=2126181 RepID=A0A8H6TCG5_9AGAR|nr:Chromatin associated protein [Mycena indigotica]KAF7316018.1 Chromatin associated protein [Mycena indigotica]
MRCDFVSEAAPVESDESRESVAEKGSSAHYPTIPALHDRHVRPTPVHRFGASAGADAMAGRGKKENSTSDTPLSFPSNNDAPPHVARFQPLGERGQTRFPSPRVAALVVPNRGAAGPQVYSPFAEVDVLNTNAQAQLSSARGIVERRGGWCQRPSGPAVPLPAPTGVVSTSALSPHLADLVSGFVGGFGAEYERLVADRATAYALRDEYENKVNTQINELNIIRQALYELEAQHGKLCTRYEEEIAHLRAELQASRSAGPGLGGPGIPADRARDGDRERERDRGGVRDAKRLRLTKEHDSPHALSRTAPPPKVFDIHARQTSRGISLLGAESPGRPMTAASTSAHRLPDHSHLPLPPMPLLRSGAASTSGLALMPAPEREKETDKERGDRERDREEEPFPAWVDGLDIASLPADMKKEGADWFAVWNPRIRPRRLESVQLLHTFAHATVVCCVQFSADGRYLATGCNRSAQIFDVKTGRKTSVLVDDPGRAVLGDGGGGPEDTGESPLVQFFCYLFVPSLWSSLALLPFCHASVVLPLHPLDGDGRYTGPPGSSELRPGLVCATATPTSLLSASVLPAFVCLGSRRLCQARCSSVGRCCRRPAGVFSFLIYLACTRVLTNPPRPADLGHHQRHRRPDLLGPHARNIFPRLLARRPAHRLRLGRPDRARVGHGRAGRRSSSPSTSPRPRPAASRDGTRDGQDAGVTSVALSPDGRYVAAGSLDNVVRIWDADSGVLLERLRGHRDSVYSVVFTPDGRGVISGSLDRTLKYWDVSALAGGGKVKKEAGVAPEGRAVCTRDFLGHKDYVLSVAVSHDAQWIVSGSKDRGVQFWDRAGAVHALLQGHKNSVISIDLSPAANLLATGSGDSLARVVELCIGGGYLVYAVLDWELTDWIMLTSV